MLRDDKKPQTSVAVLLIILFLFADLALPSAVPEWKELENSPSINRVISNVSPSADTYIDSFYPNDNFEMAQNGTLEGGVTSPTRLLFSFNMSFGSTDTIHSATLSLKCWSDVIGSTDIAIYSAAITSSWNATEATWLNSATNIMWNSPGADDSTERGDWEPPHRASMNGTMMVNVTALAQQAASSNQNTLELLIASEGAEYSCAMNDSTTILDRPSLILDTSSSAAGNGGSVTADFVDDGAPLMSGDFILKAETNPTLSYNSLVGDGVEFQLSVDPDFKALGDLSWHYSTMADIFSTTSSSGSFVVPSGDEFTNGSVIYYRVRSMDSTDTLSDWNESYFLLPSLTVTDNGDGTATVEIDADDMGLNADFIEDAQVDQRSINMKFGSNDKMEVIMSTNKESLVHMRLHLDQIGLHSNATIQSAEINLTRFSTTGSPELSIHEVNNEGVWVEDDTTWRRSDSSTLWDNGGRGLLSASSDTMYGASSSTDTSFEITDALQGWIRDGASGSKDFMVIGRSNTGDYTSSGLQGINFYSSENSDDAKKPNFELTYSWSSNTTIGTPTLTGPEQGKAVWDQVGHNLSGNSTPSLTWSSTSSSSYDVIFQIATDQFFRERVNLLDTRTDSNFTSNQGIFNLTGNDELSAGNMYFWRMSHVDNDGLRGEWSSSNFLVSGLTSTWLGGDRYEFRLSNGNGTNNGLYPECADTYIDSGSPNTNYDGETEMQISYNTWPSETSVLFNCNLVANLLPSGYAVESAQLDVKLADYPSGSPNVAIWESRQHNWTAEGATWSTYDGVNNWGAAGAKGWERGSLIDSLTIGNSYSAGDTIEWNVTLGVQNAMREDRAVDFLIGVTGVGTGTDRDIMIYPGSTSTASYRPQLSFVYVPGSDAVPNEPVPIHPLNGSWSVTSDIEVAPVHRPELGWSFGGSMSIDGWAVQIDKSTSFSSPDLLMVTSWLDTGFDTTNLTFTPSSNLDNGTTWYWRVRAISTTNQLGNWSQTYNFLLPDITTWSIDSENAAVELRHRMAMPSLNLPDFTDTYVIEGGSGSSSTYDSSGHIYVGELSTGYQSAGLIKIPLNELPTPSNARITGAELNLYSIFGSAIDEPLAIRPVLQNWNADANDTTYDGINNWSLPGGRNISTDIGNYVDIQDSVSADWMTWDVTEAVQAAQAAGSSELSLMIYASSTVTQDYVQFISTDSTSSDKPWLNLTWTNGTASIPTVAGSNTGPYNNMISWNTSSHAAIPEYKPTMSWTHTNSANIDNWRIHIMADANDDMEGLTTYDSRTQPQLFDLTNLTFTPGIDITHTREVRWMVQPVVDGMLGPRSTSTAFHIPEEKSGEVDSTTAWISLQEGAYVEPLGYPALSEDTYLDSGNRFNSFGNTATMYVGRSPLSNNHYANSLISFDIGVLPMPSIYEIQNATLEMTVASGSGSVYTSVSVMNTNWNEYSQWAASSATVNWIAPGAHQSGDSDIPFSEGEWISSSTDTVSWNLTAAIQAAIHNGQSTISLILQGEDDGTTAMGSYALHSSESTDVDSRPRINFTYSEQAPWIPSASTGLSPAFGATLWNTSTPRPSGLSEVVLNWTGLQNNETRWFSCGSDDPRMLFATCNGMNDLNGTDSAFNSTSNTLTIFNNTFDDAWTYWRVRADQNNRIGEWSDVHSYRTPDSIGYDDGSGNHTVILSRGSIFTDSGLLPDVPDVELESTVTSNQGSSTTLDLGTTSSGTGESRILLEFELGDIPWPAAMTPTSMVLKLWREQVIGTTSSTISAHACSSFSESSATWNNAPSCSTSELTRTTLTLMPPNGWYEFDLTSLAQSNIANGNMTMSVMLKVVGTPGTTHRFFSSDYSTNESRRPQLVLDYVDNTAGIIPPGQPSLQFPLDGSVLYDSSEIILQSQSNPVLSWNTVTGASGYIVTIANSTGVYKYKSWESSYINGTTFRFNNVLDAGDVFSWWVQGVNQTIPGPSSPRWSFAIGDPSHTDNQDLTFTYDFQTGNEVLQFGHTNIRDGTLSEANPSINQGDVDFLSIGTGCDSVANAKCRAIIGLDNSQIPFAPFQNIHSASLGLYIASISASGGASTLDISVHRMISSGWSQSASSWNQSTPGTNWSSPGLQAGVDYDVTAITTMTLPSTATGWIWFDIGVNGMLIDNDNQWILIATPNAGDLTLDMYSSEYMTASMRPIIQLNTTNVSSITVSPTAPTTDADTTYSFSHQAYNHQALQISAPVTWSSSDGSMDSFGLFTPRGVGTHTITACFGLICTSESITVTPGSPTTLDVTPLTGQITSDESLEITAAVVDQFGNVVAGELITFSTSNGTMGGVNGNIYYPFASGAQTVTVTWGTQSVYVQIAVGNGIPSYFELSGCEGVVPAGEWCDITHTLYDQFGNVLNETHAGLLSWSTNDGNYSELNNQYFPDHLGTWTLSLTSVSGASAEINITVGHGEMQSLELAISSTEITADERVYINTTRIDVRGNRLTVVLPSENWTKIADGQLSAGAPAIWDPVTRGAKLLQAKYESVYAEITITVSEGAINTLVLIVDSEDASWQMMPLTADETLEVKVKAIDAKGNRWTITANWSISHAFWNDQSVLEQLVNDQTTFVPYHASESPYTITAAYYDGNMIHEISINATVSHGVLTNIDLSSISSDDETSGTYDLTSDDWIEFAVELYDDDQNPIDTNILRWLIIAESSGEETDITDTLLANNMRWQASSIGNYTIKATNLSDSGYEVSDYVSITIHHGQAVSLHATEDANTATAGYEITIAITGTDSDGNTFPQNVEWQENNGVAHDINSTSVEGVYTYLARIEGPHILTYSSSLTVSNEIELAVSAKRIVAHLKVELSSEVIEQLGEFTVSVTAYDEYWNEIPVPPSTLVDSTGRAEVLNQGDGVWRIITLDEGSQSITVNSGQVNEERTFTVTGTLEGFFEAGGILYYVGAFLAAAIGIVLLIVLKMVLTGNDDEWDEEDEYDDEDDEPIAERRKPTRGGGAGPTGPAGPAGPAPTPEPEPEPEQTDFTKDESYRVDDEGTEWWEDEAGTWWYRQQGDADWEQWVD
ncbi:MAG: DNRLRE domain-containing protein [Candidatus Poseidoniaceae archaeon]|nr:DNRLRE domain-containing protein [Candidatus Poseidoniaceae archaeon]